MGSPQPTPTPTSPPPHSHAFPRRLASEDDNEDVLQDTEMTDELRLG